MSAVTAQEFSEDDEPAEDVFAAFEAGEKSRTQPQPEAPGSTSASRALGRDRPW